MSKQEVPITLLLDSDGFLRRECPSCIRQFKWRPTTPSPETALEEETASDETESSEETVYFCPYCHEAASSGSWWTQEQLEYVQKIMLNKIMRPQMEIFASGIDAMNHPGDLVRIDIQLPAFEAANTPDEPDDMIVVSFPCHPEEPVKIDEDWDREVSCLSCGISYPVELVRS